MHAPRAVDLRIDARWIVPVEPAGVLRDHALIVDGGRIVALVPSADADARLRAARARRRCPTHVLIPGLVNAHTHAAMTLMRGIADDVPLQALARASTSGRAKAASCRRTSSTTARCSRAAEMLRGGVTCCNDMYFYPGCRGARLRARRHARDARHAGPRLPDALCRRRRRLPAARASPRAMRSSTRRGSSFALAPHAPYTVGDATWAQDRRCTRASSTCRSRRTSPKRAPRSTTRARRPA